LVPLEPKQTMEEKDAENWLAEAQIRNAENFPHAEAAENGQKLLEYIKNGGDGR